MAGMLVQALRFSTPSTGWALVQDESTGELHLVVSTDSGTTWRDVTSVVAPGPARVAGPPFFSGADDGWVAVDRGAGDGAAGWGPASGAPRSSGACLQDGEPPTPSCARRGSSAPTRSSCRRKASTAEVNSRGRLSPAAALNSRWQ